MNNFKVGDIVYSKTNSVWKKSLMKIIKISNDKAICISKDSSDYGSFKLSYLEHFFQKKRSINPFSC